MLQAKTYVRTLYYETEDGGEEDVQVESEHILFYSPDGGHPIGEVTLHCYIFNSDWAAQSVKIYDEQWRGKGHGKRMMCEAVEFAKEHGINSLTLDVMLHNTPAVRAYLAAGFKHVRTSTMCPDIGVMRWEA